MSAWNVIAYLNSLLKSQPVTEDTPLPTKQSVGGTAVSTTAPLPTSGVPRMYRIAGTAMTRPANQTPYSINDSVSDNATAGSVTANPVSLADLADAPFTVERIKLLTTDTGPAAAGATFELFVFDGDPTASSGVGGGDNAAYSQKRANCIGIFSGTFKGSTGYFSDGSLAWMTPANGENRVIAKPAAGTTNLWWQLKTLTAFTPSANSTTFTPVFEGFLGRV